MVVALGITMTGDETVPGLCRADTENEQVLTPFLRSLVERGLDVSQGLLVIVVAARGSGRPCGTSATAPWCNGRQAQARERGE